MKLMSKILFAAVCSVSMAYAGTTFKFTKTPLINDEIQIWNVQFKLNSDESLGLLWHVYDENLGYQGQPSKTEFVKILTDRLSYLQKHHRSSNDDFYACEIINEARLLFNTYGRRSGPVMSYISEPEVSEKSLINLRKNAFDVYKKSHQNYSKVRQYLEKSTQCLKNNKKSCNPKDLGYAVTFIPQGQLVYHQARGQGVPSNFALCTSLMMSVQSKQLFHHRLHQSGANFNFLQVKEG